MANSTISVVSPAATYTFVVLHNPAPGSGGSPEIPREMTEVLARGGVNGVSVRLLGTKGIPFRMVGARDVLNLANVNSLISQWAGLSGKVVTINWNGVDYQSTFGLRFAVLDVHDVRRVRISRGVGGLVVDPQYWMEGVFELVAFTP